MCRFPVHCQLLFVPVGALPLHGVPTRVRVTAGRRETPLITCLGVAIDTDNEVMRLQGTQ
eukprot:15475059-Alexandrium_andersonii.AAC.1